MRYVRSESSMSGTCSEFDRPTCPRHQRVFTPSYRASPQVIDHMDAHLINY